MTSYLGNLFLWVSLLLSVVQFFLCLKQDATKLKFIRLIVKGLFCSIFLCFIILIYAHVNSDFTLINVYQNSHTTKPLIYKISGVWGNHEGSMILWMFILTIFNYFLFKLLNKKNFIFISKVLETHALIIIGFLLFTVFASNPFETMGTLHNDGLGFNPILQDPALAIHPPLLYIGYVGFSATFSISIATLSLDSSKNNFWYTYMKPFVVIAWTFLTIGIAFGSIWAYYELGWGGWWFWDPVENASFMPWLIGTALLHSLIIVEKRKSLQTWVLFLSILAFLLSVIGTFLVRSGILTSVHTFALDPSRGIYILTLASLLGGYSLILFGLKSKNFVSITYFSFLSKESAILINNIIMMIVCGTVFLGTIYPLLIETFTNNKISVGEPFFNSTIIPIVIPALIIMGIGPILNWKKEDLSKILKKIYPSILLTVIISALLFTLYQKYSFFGIVGIVLAFWIISNNLIILFKKNLRYLNFKKIIYQDLKNYSSGMIVAHLGIGLLILGITGSSVWQKEKIIRMKVNSNTNIQNYNITFNEISEIVGPNYVALQGNFLVYDKDEKFITKLNPENRFYLTTKNYTTEASIHTNLLRDLYIVLGEGNLNDGWVVRIYHNPLVIWIWIGAFTIFFGGLLSMKNNLKIIKKLNS